MNKKNKLFIPYGCQHITEDDIKSVINVLRSDYLTQGPIIDKFENAIKNYTGAKYCTVTSNATAALHLSCRVLDLSKDDIVWTSPISFVASANCALYCGAKIDFVDIDPDTFNMCPRELEKKLQKANKNRKVPKIIIVVHMAGQSSQMKEIYQIAHRYNVKIIEDASHAIGGKYQGQPIGNCRFSDMTIFSFHPVKIITTGEGGAALTNNKSIDERIKLFKGHGIIKDKNKFIKKIYGPWYYEQHELGFNYRLSDIQCALGISQLKRIDNYIKVRHQIAKIYRNHLNDCNIKLPLQYKEVYSSFHLYIIQLKESNLQKHSGFFKKLRYHNIGVSLHYFPIHLQPYYQNMGFKVGMFPKAEDYWKRSISLPIFPKLDIERQKFIIDKVKEYLY